jgi:hypothetical protein
LVLLSPKILKQAPLTKAIEKWLVGLNPQSINKVTIQSKQELEGSLNLKDIWDEEIVLKLEKLSKSKELAITTSPQIDTQVPASSKYQDIDKQDKSEKVLIECRGIETRLKLTDNKVIIERFGGFLSVHKKGIKEINYEDIADFHFQGVGFVSTGFIFFQRKNTPAIFNKSTILSDENAVCFSSDRSNEFAKAKEILSQKISPSVKPEHVFKGRSGTLVLTDTGIEIRRTGGFLSTHTAGTKTIPYRNITAVQFKMPGMTVGFIQFTLQGGLEAKRGVMEAVQDENTVTFGTQELAEEFLKAKQLIEERIHAAHTMSSIGEQKSSGGDDISMLEKLASLRDKGIITEEEFQTKKKQILGI